MNKIKKHTKQEEFWSTEFGEEYSDRNSWQTDAEWDQFYIDTWGQSKIDINNIVMADLPRDIKILEVGCNIGQQLRGFQRMGFENLYGLEIQPYAVEKAKENTKGINIIQGSAFDLPFKDGFFDLVCSNGVLIHISPDDHHKFMSEAVRCSSKYIMGWEYFEEDVTHINYRGNTGFLWKANFAKIYQDIAPELKVLKRHQIPYVNSPENKDEIFFLSK